MATNETTASQSIAYETFYNSIKHLVNARDYRKANEAIEKLTDQDLLSEIINSNQTDWKVERDPDNYAPYHVLDLRDTARIRLKALQCK